MAVWWSAALVGGTGCSDSRDRDRPDPNAPASRAARGASPSKPASQPARGIRVDTASRSVWVPVRAARQGTYAELKGAIEYVLVSEDGKAYESLFVTKHTPKEIHEALSKTGLPRGRAAADGVGPRGKGVRIFVERVQDGKTVRRPIDAFVVAMKGGKPLAPVEWVYTGSAEATDPATGKRVLQASMTRSVVGLHHSDPSVLVQNPRPEAAKENIYRANVKALPAPAAAVWLVFQRVMPRIPPGTRRAHVFLSGRVQGVGFRAFTQRQARLLGLGGFVRNLRDGRVEAVVEGPAEKVNRLLAKVRRGPRPARVERARVTDEPPEGDLKEFEIRY